VSNHISETSLKWQNFDEKHVILNDNIDIDTFKTHFFIHYCYDFDFYIRKSIFLYENKEYLNCSNFGYKYDSNDDLLLDVLRNVKNDKLFNEYGLIRYSTSILELAKRYSKEVDNKTLHLDKYYNEFITHNPLITENLKIYL
jgi:hypothetical protein